MTERTTERTPDDRPVEQHFADEPHEVDVVSRETIHSGYVWDVVSERFRFGDAEITREFVDHTGAVAILALDEEDRVLLIQQYRHPVRMCDWELPAGLLDEPGEPALAAAKRELAEEADLEASEWSVLVDFFTTPGGNNESIRIFLARGLSATAEPFERTDEEADIVIRWTPLDDALEQVLRGGLHNPSAVIAIRAAAHERGRGWRDLRPADAEWPTRPKGPESLSGK